MDLRNEPFFFQFFRNQFGDAMRAKHKSFAKGLGGPVRKLRPAIRIARCHIAFKLTQTLDKGYRLWSVGTHEDPRSPFHSLWQAF